MSLFGQSQWSKPINLFLLLLNKIIKKRKENIEIVSFLSLVVDVDMAKQ
jgi:hypothetical protein